MKTHDLSSLPILLLAAGQSSRMRGRDKLLEDIDGVPLLRRQVERALRATDGEVLVTLPPKPHPRRDVLKGLVVTQVAVPDADLGMSTSLTRGLAAVPQTAKAVMVLLADMPEITHGDMKTVLRAVEVQKTALIWRGTTSDGVPGHPIVFARQLFKELACVTGDTGGAPVVARHKDVTALIRLPGTRARLDLDTPEAWVQWRQSRAETP